MTPLCPELLAIYSTNFHPDALELMHPGWVVGVSNAISNLQDFNYD